MGENVAGETPYRKGLTRTTPCGFFSFRKQAQTVGLLSTTWSASMGRAHRPAGRSRIETSLMFHLSPLHHFPPPIGGSPSVETEAQLLALLGKEAGGRWPGGR